MNRNPWTLLPFAVALSACSFFQGINSTKPSATDDTETASTAQPADKDFYRNAYEQGVRETLQEYKQRLRARQEYVYEPPLVQDVDMPARIVNGTFYPAHRQKVIVKPGRWVQENAIPAPEAGSK